MNVLQNLIPKEYATMAESTTKSLEFPESTAKVEQRGVRNRKRQGGRGMATPNPSFPPSSIYIDRQPAAVGAVGEQKAEGGEKRHYAHRRVLPFGQWPRKFPGQQQRHGHDDQKC